MSRGQGAPPSHFGCDLCEAIRSWPYAAGVPLSAVHLQQWTEESGRWLFHRLQRDKDLPSVLATGLQHRNAGWDRTWSPRANAVYLSSDPDLYGTHIQTSIEELDPGCFLVDEDWPRRFPHLFGPQYLAASRAPHAPSDPFDRPITPRQQEAGEWADTVDDDCSENVLISLRLGSVAHRGTIPPDALEPFSANPRVTDYFERERYDRLFPRHTHRYVARQHAQSLLRREDLLAWRSTLPNGSRIPDA